MDTAQTLYIQWSYNTYSTKAATDMTGRASANTRVKKNRHEIKFINGNEVN